MHMSDRRRSFSGLSHLRGDSLEIHRRQRFKGYWAIGRSMIGLTYRR